MNQESFYADGTRVLKPDAFEFVLSSELKRAVRAQSFLTLITLEARRVWDGLTVAADDGTLSELAELVSREVRDTDHIGQTDRGALGLMLLEADPHGGSCVIGRVMSRIDHYRFSAPLSISIGAASCPTHAVDAEALKREASSRPMISARRGVNPGTPTEGL
jgi:hypothetical protein